MPRTVNVNYVTKEVKILLHDSETESLAAATAIAAAESAQEAKDVVVDSLQDSLDAIDAKTETEKTELDNYTDTKKTEISSFATEELQPYVTAAAASAQQADTTATALTTFLETKETLTAPAVDTTLSVTGAAADAKITGTQLRSRYKIGGALAANTDLNNVTEIGCYFLSVSIPYTNSPIPSSVAGILEVLETSADASSGTKIQRVTTYNIAHPTTYYRRRLGASNWSTWRPQDGETVFKWMSALAANTDLNNVTEIGFYYLSADTTYTNSPISSKTGGFLEVYKMGATVLQKATPHVSTYPVVKIRRKFGDDWNDWNDVGYSIAQKNKENAFELYTEFDYEAGWWNGNGSISSTDSQRHTNLIPVRPNTQYYMGYKVGGNTCYGAFLDETGRWIAPLLDADFTQHTYKIPNGDPDSALTNYVALYTFTTPANASFFSYNLSENASNTYRLYLCSKPIFMLTGSGDYVIRNNDALYQRWKDKKLCVIGSSNTMIDRLSRTVDGNARYIVGFQEYLVPFFDSVESFGYSGASWKKYDVEDGASVRSIYSRIVTDQLDLSGYDVFILLQSGNGLTSDSIGSVTSPTDLGDNETYVGAMRQVIDYIYSQNPYAIVYVTGIRYRAGYELGYACNEEVKKMANFISCPYVDMWSDLGMNQYNQVLYSYDGGSHCNQEGNQLIGMVIRKAVIGI